ncbi:MAG: metallophosphoesterase, partial [Actinobacteria bacterium]|nr:metallophosphoesterase [Actinomycetota bacterium]
IPNTLHQAVYVKVAGRSEPKSYTWTVPDRRRIAGGITTYAGVDPTHPVDAVEGSANPVPGTAVTAPSVTPAVAGTLLVLLVAVNAEGSLSPPSGMTGRWTAGSRHSKTPTDVAAAAADSPWAPAAATGARTATATEPGGGIGVLLALRPAPSPAPAPPTPTTTQPPPPPPATDGDPVMVGAGDIATCDDTTGARATAALLDNIKGTVFALGDNAYVNGTADEFRNCYDPSWGRHKARTAITVAGNHDYNTPGATGYYGYFGAAAGDPAKGYYDTTLGDWHVVVLNSNCEEVGGCGAGSPQEQWLRDVLAASDAKCTLALWHEPGFSSATVHRAFPKFQPFWQALYDYGADAVLVASDHVYERFGLQGPAGDADAAFGLRQFTVGTGGRSHQLFKTVLPNSEVRNGGTYGVLKLTLHPDSYDWRFVPEAGKTFTDEGTTACHGAPPPAAPDPGPIVPVGSSSNSASGARSLTLGRPAKTVAGQVMVASIVTSDDAPAVAGPDGWTVVRNDVFPGALRQTLYTRVAETDEPPSYTWTLSGRAQVVGGLTSYAGVDPTHPVDADAANTTAAGATATAPSITTSAASTRLIQFVAVNAEGTLVAPDGLVQRWLAAAPVGATFDALAAAFDATEPSAGPANPSAATATEPGDRITVLLALRPSN